ncbi:DEAD/DEAH box helicase [Entomospira entomophila]|uniref:DEAD/DEAH box helicase n=1 Tax=Entomospira entomophila TaxID=2719988 RepID=A0A968GD82_9SPIO|nr:DEAD/DEAH box helicase [Entomospira entomophilus]NIZ40294.1 DEAD/DEAH box helicase [Entomospira entomophilus]WDI35853.1 DEAD/DEAH box helicase [Entomospira entomophilus]
MQFSQFPLDPRLLRGLDLAQYVTCTPVQEATLQAVLEHGKDVYAQSQTGTGKTAAFLIATFWHLLKPENHDKFALILAPTRELVVQIEKEARTLGQFLKFPMAAIYGGVSIERQRQSLLRKPRIIVATPGRLQDFINQQTISLKNAGVLVIDEADRLFDMGFHKDLLRIVKMLPAPQQRLNLLFSATLNNKVGQLAWEHMNNPESIVIKSEYPTVEGISQHLFHVSRSEKMILLLAVLKKENPESAIIFSNTKAGARQISLRLQRAGYNCALIEGNIPQKKRLDIIAKMKAGKIKFLAATDVASRGIHIPNLSLVINFDLPDDAENYVHRIGRTARGTQTTGKAISFACERFVYNLSSIEKLIKKKISVTIIDDALKQIIDDILKENPDQGAISEKTMSGTPQKSSQQGKAYTRKPHGDRRNQDKRHDHDRRQPATGGSKSTGSKYPPRSPREENNHTPRQGYQGRTHSSTSSQRDYKRPNSQERPSGQNSRRESHEPQQRAPRTASTHSHQRQQRANTASRGDVPSKHARSTEASRSRGEQSHGTHDANSQKQKNILNFISKLFNKEGE